MLLVINIYFGAVFTLCACRQYLFQNVAVPTFWGNSCSLGEPFVLNVICLLLILAISYLGKEGMLLVLIVFVPCLAYRLLFNMTHVNILAP